MSNHYETLGVSRDASADEIKKAYRKLARKLHPDVNPGHEDEFKQVSVAYEVLSDEAKRRNYDNGGGEYGQAGGAQGFGGFSDLFETFFGGGMGGGRPQPASRRQRGKDALLDVEISLETAAFGGKADLDVVTAETCDTCHGEGTRPGTTVQTCSLCGGAGSVQQMTRTLLGQMVTNQTCSNCGGFGTTIPDPCNNCHGEGRVRVEKTLTVRIPAGVSDGTRIQLAGQGEVGRGGGPAGDLFIELSVARDPVFTRDGDHLRATITVPMTAAALGATVPLETFDGPQDIEIEPGTQSGTEKKLVGLGAKRLRRDTRGDLLVTILVQTPTGLDAAQREILEQLAAARGESEPTATVSEQSHHRNPFSRLREKFAGR